MKAVLSVEQEAIEFSSWWLMGDGVCRDLLERFIACPTITYNMTCSTQSKLQQAIS